MKRPTYIVGNYLPNARHVIAAVVVSAGFAAAPVTGAQPVVTERRFGLYLTSGGLAGGAVSSPVPIVDVAVSTAAGTATFNYNATWRAWADDSVVERLTEIGIYWSQGGPVTHNSHAHRHHLQVQARSRDEAFSIAFKAIVESGGEVAHRRALEILPPPDPDRRRRMVRAAREIIDEQG